LIYDPIIPIPWILSIAVVMLGAAIYHQVRSGRRLGKVRSGFLLITRLAAIALILILLLQPMRQESVPVPAVVKSLLFAIDTSASMKEPHRDGSSRIDAARAHLEAAGVLDANDRRLQWFTFSSTAAPSDAEQIRLAPCDGQTTKIDTSIAALLRMTNQAPPAGLFILSDGHDFDLVPPGEIARRTRARDIPIFTIPYGTMESARDVSVSIANYHPHTFVRQKTRLEALVRTFGCPHEILTIDLLCNNEKVQSKKIQTNADPFQSVAFDVTHEEPGQFEYSYRIAPIANEREINNNKATTYLNVISERIQVLEIEGRPFWDSTFLRRSFNRNDKFDIDSLVAFTEDRVRPIRSNAERPTDDLKAPVSVDDFKPYNMVILGREVERVIGEKGILALESWVKNYGGIVIFGRGKAWSPQLRIAADLEPIDWNTEKAQGVRLEVTPQAGSLSAFRILREVAAEDEFPEVISFATTGEPKTLATTFSVTSQQSPAAVYRRYGDGQTLSLGVGNLWRWVFNPKAQYDNNAYDRFWDQIALWLLANGGITPSDGYSLRTDTSNLPLGETIHLRFGVYGDTPRTTPPPITIYKDDQLVTTLALKPKGNSDISEAEFTPRQTGQYRAEVKTADGKTLNTRFIVFQEEMETTETAMDLTFLEQLAKTSGGRMLDPGEIAEVKEALLRDTNEQDPLTRRIPLWDKPWIYFLLCALLGLEWHNRRRWGLT